MEKEIIFVTHNTGKIKSAEKYFKNLKFKTFNYELDEPRSDDIKEIATAKVKEAFEIVKRPCIALDTDFRIDKLNGFPRAFVNFALDTIGINGILKLMEGEKIESVPLMNVWHIMMGKIYTIFMENILGNLSIKIQGLDREEKWSDLWYIFKPKGFDKTLAEMDSEERENRKKIDGSVQAMQEFANWYENRIS